MLIKRDFIYSPKGTNRPLHIWLPDDYFESEERYPVMYFFDGHNLFFNEEIFVGLSQNLVCGSLINFAVMFFIVYNLIKTACNPDLFGLFSPRLSHLWRHRKQHHPKIKMKM